MLGPVTALSPMKQSEIVLILDNIRSAQNVGAIFRTADAAGVTKIYLVGITPTPVDRFGRTQPQIAKTALGATDTVAWEHVSDEVAISRIARIREEGGVVVAVEQTDGATDLYSFTPPSKVPVAYIFGNEVDGVTQRLCAVADEVVMIPMRGQKESLNVAVSVGIILYHR